MSKKGKKKKGAPTFALSAKVNQDEDLIKQYQVNKKILQDKFYIQKTKAEDAVKKLTEAKTRLVEVRQYKVNEVSKYKSIESDFIHQSVLMDKNYREKLEELRGIFADREKKVNDLKATLAQMKADHEAELAHKAETFLKIKTNMESLSTDFAKKLTDIQNDLKKQTEKVSQKWEHNPSDHLKNFETETKKYDITKDSDK